jgi:hypothetical protein
MDKKQFTGNAILWAAAILASALVGAPPVLSLLLLPSLAVGAFVINRPRAKSA